MGYPFRLSRLGRMGYSRKGVRVGILPVRVDHPG